MLQRLKLTWRRVPAPARQAIVLVVGGALIIAGAGMLVLPGPGWATIFLGLAVLASEFSQAEKLRAAVVRRFKNAIEKAKAVTKR